MHPALGRDPSAYQGGPTGAIPCARRSAVPTVTAMMRIAVILATVSATLAMAGLWLLGLGWMALLLAAFTVAVLVAVVRAPRDPDPGVVRLSGRMPLPESHVRHES